MKVAFSKVITKKWKSHLEVWVAKRHIHGWLLAKPYIYIYIYLKTQSYNVCRTLFSDHGWA